MNTARSWVLVSLLGVAGCGAVDSAKLARAMKSTPPPLGVMQSREYAIEVYAGPVFTVLSAKGEVLAELVTIEQLQASLPDVYRGLEHVYAANLASSLRHAGIRQGPDLEVTIDTPRFEMSAVGSPGR